MSSLFREWAVSALVGVACSAPPSFIGPASNASADAGPSAMTACGDLATAQCAELEGCSSVLMQTRYGTLATCQVRLAATCATALVAPSTGNSAAQVEACAQAYPSWSCTDYLGNVNLPAACAQRAGGLATGNACAFAAQCATGFCAIPPNAACGACAPQPQLGDSCSNLSSCGQRLICLSGSQVCGTFGAAGAMCSNGAPCGAHLSCIGADAATGALGTCEASAELTGVACDPTLKKGPGCDYDDGLTCNGQTKKCAPLTISAGGGPCNSNNDQFAACAAGGTCSTSETGAMGTCMSGAADGHACTVGGEGPACLQPARCIVASDSSTSGTCEEDDGAACK